MISKRHGLIKKNISRLRSLCCTEQLGDAMDDLTLVGMMLSGATMGVSVLSKLN